MSDEANDPSEEKDRWFVDQTIHINVPPDISEDDLQKSLAANRARLDRLKTNYWEKKREKSEDDRENRTYRSELSRVVTAIEALKDKLALKGAEYAISQWDREHPEAAYRRLERKYQGELAVEANEKRLRLRREAEDAERRRVEAMGPIARFLYSIFD